MITRLDVLQAVAKCISSHPSAQTVKACPECGKPLNYDSFEDCYLCSSQCGCYWIGYPKDFGEQDNKDAGIWRMSVCVDFGILNATQKMADICQDRFTDYDYSLMKEMGISSLCN
jgi:hypothetical protein